MGGVLPDTTFSGDDLFVESKWVALRFLLVRDTRNPLSFDALVPVVIATTAWSMGSYARPRLDASAGGGD